VNGKEGAYPLRIKIKDELLPLVLLVIVLIAAITLFPNNILRIILGLPFVLFFPGYTLMAALFPRRGGMGSIERVALSFGSSIAVVPLIGLILNYTPWGIRLESTLWFIASFIFITAAIAWFRRRKLPKEERFGGEFQLKMPSWGTSVRDKALSIILALAIVGALGMMGYVIAVPKAGEKFTEFYILGQEGKALKGMSESTYLDIIEGRAEVRDILIVGRTKADDVFFEEKWGRIAVVFVTRGKTAEPSFTLNQGIPVRVWRGEELVNESVVSSLNSLKENAETTSGIVSTGYLIQAVAVAKAIGMLSLAGSVGEEIGIGIEGFNEFQVGDMLEFFTPTELTVGQEIRNTIGIVNHEYRIVSYRLEVRTGGVKNNEVKGITLEHGERWEEIVPFTLSKAGGNQKVEFLLYKDGGVQPCLEPLRLWIDVTEKPPG